jgi:hypothetical protein
MRRVFLGGGEEWKPEGTRPLSKPRGGCDGIIYVDF